MKGRCPLCYTLPFSNCTPSTSYSVQNVPCSTFSGAGSTEQERRRQKLETFLGQELLASLLTLSLDFSKIKGNLTFLSQLGAFDYQMFIWMPSELCLLNPT